MQKKHYARCDRDRVHTAYTRSLDASCHLALETRRGLHAFFAMLFVGSALLFRSASVKSLMRIKTSFATLLTLAPIVLAILTEEDDCGYAILQRAREF